MNFNIKFTICCSIGCVLILLLAAECAHPGPTPEALVTEIDTCREWDAELDKPLGTADHFSQHIPQICMFVYVEANQELWFVVSWYKDSRLISQHKLQHSSGYLHDCLKPRSNDSFGQGTYEVVLRLGKRNFGSSGFVVSGDGE